MGNRNAPVEKSHLWVLAKMLTTLEKKHGRLMHFMKYVIAASHPKIKLQLKSIRSKVSFESVMSEDMNFTAVQASSKRDRSKNELENNCQFLITLGKGKIVPNYEEQYPNISNVLKETSTDVTAHCAPTFELFNIMACMEYHNLFMALMKQYRELVKNIALTVKNRQPFEDNLVLIVKTGHALDNGERQSLLFIPINHQAMLLS